MDAIDFRTNIRNSRPSNIARLSGSFALLFLSFYYQIPNLLVISALSFFFSLSWLFYIEFFYSIYHRNPISWYIISTVDLFFISIAVYLTGLYYSPLQMAYILTVTVSSIDIYKERGLYVAYVSFILFGILLFLVHLKFLPLVNLFYNTNLVFSINSAILSLIMLLLSVIVTNKVVNSVYQQFHDKNKESEHSLKEIQTLKEKQDGDYFLTSILIEPLSIIDFKSSNLSIEVFIKQYKEFEFRGAKAELGGDICIIRNIFLGEENYIFFMNADAMGKSMQGAGGVLVLSSVINSFLNRYQDSGGYMDPYEWLIICFGELNNIFQSFEGLMMVSCIFGVIDENTGKMLYINAEHPFPILLRDNKALFLNEKHNGEKLGSPGAGQLEYIDEFLLEKGDTIFIGSDGKDDLLISKDQARIIDNDEFRILSVIEEAEGDLNRIVQKLEEKGNFSDDCSIISIFYKGNVLDFI